MIKILIVLVVMMLVLVMLHHTFPFIQVCGSSMYPTYRDSEVIVGYRLYRKKKLNIGDVILYHSPMEKDRVVIKRIANIKKEGKNLLFYCLGDNPDESYDSRYYGWVSSKNFVCRVINQRRNANVCD